MVKWTLIILAFVGPLGAVGPSRALTPPPTVVGDCFFDPGSVELLPECQTRLRAMMEQYRPYHDDVWIQGFADASEGRDARGQQLLSERRAQAVRHFLVMSGVPANVIRVTATGATDYPARMARAGLGYTSLEWWCRSCFR